VDVTERRYMPPWLPAHGYGDFVGERRLTHTLGAGAVWDVDFSRDPQQQFLYTNDGMNNRISILLRAPLQGNGSRPKPNG
jgi:hypothetical protein